MFAGKSGKTQQVVLSKDYSESGTARPGCSVAAGGHVGYLFLRIFRHFFQTLECVWFFLRMIQTPLISWTLVDVVVDVQGFISDSQLPNKDSSMELM